MPTLPIVDFSGGMTDDYIDGDPSSAEKMDNLLVTSNGKPKQRPAFTIYNSSAPQIPPGNQAIDSLYYFDSTLFVKSGTKLYYLKDGDTSWTTLAGPAHDAFADSELGAKCSWSEWKGHLFITPGPSTNKKGGCRTVKVYRNASNVWTLVQAGIPRADDGTRVPAAPGPFASLAKSLGPPQFHYTWYAVLARSYVAKVNGNDVTFTDFGTPSIWEDDCDAFESGAQAGIAWDGFNYTNGTYENYDTATMDVRLYRTEKNGSAAYRANTVSLGATGIPDGVDDEDLAEEIYPGAVDGSWNDPPPLCYFSQIVDGLGWFLTGVDLDSGEFQVNRAWQSKTADVDSAPGGNYVDLEGDVPTAFDHAGTHPVVFFRNRTYRLEGRFDSLGGGFIRAVLISAVEGSVSQQVTRTTDGIYFNSESGLCYTNGFQVMNLSKHLRATYKALSNRDKAAWAYHAKEKRAYVGVESSALVPSVTGKNNSLMILDENYTQGDRGCFTTATSGANLQPNSLHYDSRNDRLLVGDSRGYVFKFDDTLTSDPVVNTATAYSTWYRTAVVYDWISVAFSFGNPLVHKWVTRLAIIAKNLTGNLSLDLFSHNDDKTATKQMKVVRERGVTSSGVHKVWRWFPKGGLRCFYKQAQVSKGNVIIAASDDYALATTNTGAKTVLLAGAMAWPNDGSDSLVGHSVYFATDSYTAGYLITVHSGDTLTVSTTPPAVTAGKWEVKGYPKNETVELHAVSMDFDMIQDGTPKAYAEGGDGSNS